MKHHSEAMTNETTKASRQGWRRRMLAAGAVLLVALSSHAADEQEKTPQSTPATAQKTATAVFAGGCFWCMEKPFDDLDGVVSTTSGYTGGTVKNPTYEQVSDGVTGHSEAVQVVYDPSRVTYEKLLDVFWHNVDPTDDGGQFCDRGSQYKSAIYVQDDEQRRIAEASKKSVEEKKPFAAPIVTRILPAGPFYPAEDDHQNYYREHPLSYRYYRYSCGRDQRLEQLWGDEAGSH